MSLPHVTGHYCIRTIPHVNYHTYSPAWTYAEVAQRVIPLEHGALKQTWYICMAECQCHRCLIVSYSDMNIMFVQLFLWCMIMPMLLSWSDDEYPPICSCVSPPSFNIVRAKRWRRQPSPFCLCWELQPVENDASWDGKWGIPQFRILAVVLMAIQ
jgi:hypothetical protein